MENVSEKEQRNTWREDGVWGCWWVRSRDAWMAELGESWREANRGQVKHEELACDGSCPGLILSVCAGWQEGCKERLDPLLIATHSGLSLIWTESQQIGRLGYRNSLLCVPLRPPNPPLSFHLPWSALHAKSLTEFNYTHCPCSTPTSAAPPAGSWLGEGQKPPGNRFIWRLLVHALTRFFLRFAFPLRLKGFSLFWHRQEKNRGEKKDRMQYVWVR